MAKDITIMRKIIKVSQAVAIYPNKYEIVCIDPNRDIVKAYVAENRRKFNQLGAKLIINNGFINQ